MERVWDPLRRKEVALTPEESVRQWFISVLKDEAGVPLHMMRSEVSMDYGGKTSRADIVVYRRDLSPAMIVECKRPSVALSPKVLDQALRYHSLMDAGWWSRTAPTPAFSEGRKDSSQRSLSCPHTTTFNKWKRSYKDISTTRSSALFLTPPARWASGHSS